MDATAAEFHIGIITDSPQTLTPLIDLLKSQPHYQIDLHPPTAAPSSAWDVIVDCAVSAAAGAAFVKQAQTPVITLLDQPTVEQAVDLMRAGSSGVADGRDTGRVLDLIRAALDAGRKEDLQAASSLLRYKAVVSSTIDGISVVNRNYIYELVNAAYLERTHLSQAQIEGHHVAEILGEDAFQQRIKPQLDRCLAGEVIRYSDWFDFAGIGKRYLMVTYVPNRDARGGITGVVVNTRDITEQKQAEDELRAREEQLKSLIESQTNYVIRTDLEGRYAYWNPKFEREYGWLHEPDGLFGKVALDSICAHHHERAWETVSKCLAQPGVPVQVELDKPARDGGVRTTLWEFLCLTDAGGAAIGFQCAGIDITAQKQAQAAVEFQAKLLKQVSDAVITTDTDLKITTWNHAAARIYGWTEAEALGQYMNQLVQPEISPEHFSDLLKTLDQTGHWRGEIVERDKAGERHIIVASMNRLYDEQHEPIGTITVNRDISVEKRRARLQERVSILLEAIATGEALPAILESLVRAIEEFSPEIKASVLLLDAKTKQLRRGAAPSLPAAYNAAIDGLTIGAGKGSCGTAAFEKRLVIVEDIATDPLWQDFKQLAAAHGLKACWSQPVIGQNGAVLATFAMYYAAPRRPSADELDLIQLAAHIAGLAIEHAQAEIALREGEERFREFMRYLPGSVQIKDDAGYVLYCNECYAALNDRTPEEIVGTRPTDRLSEDMARMFDHEHERVLRENRALEFYHDLQRGAENVRFWTIRFPILRAGKPPLIGTMSLDVTREKLAEDALKRSEERYRQMFERVRLPKFIVDPHTAAILDANPGAVEFYGYPLETLKTMTMLDINLAEPDFIREKLRQVMAGEISSCAFTQRLADGSTRDTESYAVAIEHNGQPAVYCTYIDVTERNRAQAALEHANQALEQRVLERTAELREERNLLRTVIDTVPDFIYVKDAQHRMVLNNAAHARSLGEHSEGEIVGKTDFAFFPPDMAAKFHADEDRLFATEQALINAEERSIGEKGGEIWALTTKVPLRNLQGKLIGLVGITHDVTVMKAAAEALQISEERYRATIAAMSEGLIVQNRDGSIVVCNNAAEWLLGLTADQMLGRRSVDPRWRAVHEDGSPFPGETHPAMVTLRTGQPQHGVVMGVHKPDGALTWLLINSKPLFDPADGKPYAVVTTFADISAPKQAEAVIKAALAQEKELGELKSRLVSMASHEFRTPLASILAATETLIRYWERLDKEKIDERLERVREQVEHMTAITEDVLQLSRLQMRRAKYEPEAGDLDGLCAHVVSKLAELPDVGRRIAYECPQRPVNAVFDARLIEQVIINLLDNALKYSPVEKPVQIRLTHADGMITLRIADQGIGIPPESLKRLFEPFHRAGNVGAISGTGLGLPIAKEAVELHDGTIAVESQVGVGTTFIVTLPAP